MQITEKVKPVTADSGEPYVEISSHKTAKWLPLLLFLFAFLVRCLYLITMRSHPWLLLPVVDEIDLDHIARLIHQEAISSVLPFFRPPLWPILLSGVYSFFSDNFLFARLTALVLGAISVASLYRLAIQLFSFRTSLISALIYAVSGVVIHMHVSALDTSLLLLLFLEAMVYSLRFRQSGSTRHVLLAGGFWGLAILCRPISAIGLLVVIGDALIRLIRSSPRATRPQLQRSGLLAALPLLLLVPIAWMNLSHGGSVIASNNGINFYLGNHATADGVSPVHPQFGPGWLPTQVHRDAEEEVGSQLTPAEVSRWYTSRTIREMLQSPLHTLLHLGKKAILAFSGISLSNNGDLTYFRDTRPFLKVTSLVDPLWILPLGLLGLAAFWRENARSRVVGVTALLLLLATVGVFITTRFRLPAIVLLLPFAVAWVERAFFSKNKRVQMIRSLAVASAALLLLNLPALSIAPKPNPAYGLFLDGQLHAHANLRHEAIQFFEGAIREDPNIPYAHNSLGYLYLDLDRFEKAINAFQTEATLRENAQSYRGMGIVYRATGDLRKAAEAFATAWRLDPADHGSRQMHAESLATLGLELFSAGGLEEALRYFTEAEEINPQNPFYAFGRACCRYAGADTAHAQAIIDSLAVIHPDFPGVRDWIDRGWRPE